MTAERGLIEGEGKTAVVVEDERLVRMLIVDALQECGYSVLEAADGLTGVHIIESSKQIDVLVSDHNLPGGITGYELAEHAGRLWPQLRIVLVSGLPGSVVTGSQPLPDRMRLLAKPFTMVRLLLTISEIIGAATARSEVPEEPRQ